MGIFDLFKKKDKTAPIIQTKPVKETVPEEEKQVLPTRCILYGCCCGGNGFRAKSNYF